MQVITTFILLLIIVIDLIILMIQKIELEKIWIEIYLFHLIFNTFILFLIFNILKYAI